MYFCHLRGCPEVAVLVGWDISKPYADLWSLHQDYELLLATDNSTADFERNYHVLEAMGFTRSPQRLKNPNTERWINFWACRREDFTPKIPVTVTPQVKIPIFSPLFPREQFPAQCALGLVHDISAVHVEKKRAGKIAIVPDDNESLLHRYLDLGFNVAHKLRTKSILYRKETQNESC